MALGHLLNHWKHFQNPLFQNWIKNDAWTRSQNTVWYTVMGRWGGRSAVPGPRSGFRGVWMLEGRQAVTTTEHFPCATRHISLEPVDGEELPKNSGRLCTKSLATSALKMLGIHVLILQWHPIKEMLTIKVKCNNKKKVIGDMGTINTGWQGGWGEFNRRESSWRRSCLS